MRFFEDTYTFDFGDDDHMSGIYWTATVTIDRRYETIQSYTIDGVHGCGKIFKWNDTPSDIKERIKERMDSITLEEFAV